jgi:plastocyanin
MSDRPITSLSAGTILALALAACSAASPGPSTAPVSSEAAVSAGASASVAPTGSAAASVSASQPATARCAVTADASPTATVHIAGFSFGAAVTVNAGQAVVFSNEDTIGHTVTEGTGGIAVADACVDASVAPGSSLVVTFSQPGDYDITCKIHHVMQTTVHVQ